MPQPPLHPPASDHTADAKGSRYPVVVCGSNYGRVYDEALWRAPERFPIVAVLGRGSERSRRHAKHLGVPLCTRLGELPPEVRLACAAMPASADAIVLELLARGIHVLCEHPRTPAFLADAYAVADRSGVAFDVNGHFSDLPAARVLAERSHRALAAGPLRFVELVAQERSLYAALDVLASALPGIEKFELERTADSQGFVSLEGEMAAGTASAARAGLRIQVPDAQLADGSSGYLVDIRLHLGFDSGVLSLSSIAGPVVWNANLAVAAVGGAPLWQIDGAAPSAVDLRDARATANLEAVLRLTRLAASAGGTDRDHERAERRRHAYAVSRVWEALSSRLRRP